jgi:hypothetical protein
MSVHDFPPICQASFENSWQWDKRIFTPIIFNVIGNPRSGPSFLAGVYLDWSNDMLRRGQTAETPHPGINISKIPVGGGIAGMLAALSIIIIGLIGLPVTRWFLGASLVVGVLIALLRRWIARA